MTQNTEEFAFEADFSDCIAHVVNGWATLEYYLNDTIWALAKLDPAMGACLTSNIFTFAGRLNALLALMKVRKLDDKLIEQVNKLADQSRGPNEFRNRVVHDMWLVDKKQSDKMGKFEITAQKKLIFKFQEVTLKELRSGLEKIDACRKEALAIRSKIKDALPKLPAAVHVELYPVLESPKPEVQKS